MRHSRSFAFAAALGIASVIAAVSCTLNTEGGLADVPPTTPDSSLGGSGGYYPDVIQEKDTSVEGDTAKPDVKPDVHEAGDVVTEQQECFPGMKSCGGECVPSDVPEYGCSPSECKPCNLPHAVESCTADHCAVTSCELINPNDNPDANPKAPRWGDCNAPKWDDGCETRLDTPQNCGQCGVTCSPVDGVGNCQTGECAIGSCNQGKADCDGKLETGCEIDTNNDVGNCGACGNVCKLTPGATAMTCLNGVCVPDVCAAGRKDCDGNAANGCETDITQIQNCGGCGLDCTGKYLNGVAECVAVGTKWECALKECVAPFDNCDGSPGNGCEANTQTNPVHCGACNTTCSSVNGTNPQCSAGKCVLTCNSDFTNCEDPAHPEYDTSRNGCETNIKGATGDPLNCGGCGWACDKTNASAATCSNGACAYTCNLNFENCNGALPGNIDDGCEVDRRNDPGNCGGCGKVCSSNGGTAVCNAGACNTQCDADHANCNGQVTDGCEINIKTDKSHCGSCGGVCQGGNANWECVNGVCDVQSCSVVTYGNCDNLDSNGCEASLSTTANCGQCGKVCGTQNATATCTNATCNILCQDSWGNCDNNPANGCETQVSSNPASCGPSCTQCAQPANSTSKCTGGVCGFDCTSGFGNCDSNNANGCEVNLSTTVTHCGVCNKVCMVANGVPNCNAGTCGIASCSPGFGNCDNNLVNGCESSVSSDPAKCGPSCTNCPDRANAARKCTNGVCGFDCNTGFGNCDNNAATGCETDINTSLLHCGGCGTACTGKHATAWTCTSGICFSTQCEQNWGNCDLDATNGCETNLLTTTAHCGGCNNPCNGNKACVNGTCQ